MKVPQEAIDLIKHYEGYRSKEYICPAGRRTIGFGHVILEGEIFDDEIDYEFAEALLQLDLVSRARQVCALVKVPLTDEQFGALCSFVFNLGSGALQRSTLRMKLNRCDYVGAAFEFPKWIYSGKRKLRGLINRRTDEMLMFLGVNG